MEGLLASKTTSKPKRFCISVHVAQVKGKVETRTLVENLGLPHVWSAGDRISCPCTTVHSMPAPTGLWWNVLENGG